ncbi:MGMT family protein [Rosenbergiella australiborealis]|uniref:MGMT family protein n=1 Tax=Rosenbergiella australiborealis TaxID=1544696 RepID=UPI001F4EAEC9|nr:MGMT family protein [Rosenbergiella australiborealis]
MPTFEQQVWLIVSAIPYGCVASYGDLARLCGHPRSARQVGRIMKNLPDNSTLPWYRVINQQGKLSLSGSQLARQAAALRAEGIIVSDAMKVDMERYRWRP